MVGGGPGGSAIGALACGLGTALVAGALGAGCAAALVLHAASMTADAPVIRTGARQQPRHPRSAAADPALASRRSPTPTPPATSLTGEHHSQSIADDQGGRATTSVHDRAGGCYCVGVRAAWSPYLAS